MAISLTDRFCRGVAAHLRTRLIRVGLGSIISFRKILDPGFTFSTQLRSKPGEPERSHLRQAKDTSQTSPNPKTAARIGSQPSEGADTVVRSSLAPIRNPRA